MTWLTVLRLGIGFLGIVSAIGRWAERLSGRLQGRAEQRLANAEEQLEQVRNATKNTEDVRRMSESDLDSELRSDARK